VNRVAQSAQRRGAHPVKHADPAGKVAQRDPSVVARRQAFLTLESHRESLAARAPRQLRARRRYEDLCLVKMVTRVQRDYLSQPTTGGEPTGIDGNGLEALEDGVADWAQPWGPTCLLQLQADLHVFDGKLKSARRWLSARRRRQAEASAGERFVEIMARMGASLKAAEFAVPSWASSAQPVSRKTAARRTAPNPASRPGAPQRVASRRAEPRPVAPGRDGPGAGVDRGLDINEATFGELCALKLSSTQSRRVIAYRTRIHGFESIDQLDEVPGFPKKVRDQLRHQLTV
jgi:DNA uptake protein ComE-like DNA-binding protein